jgi:hypothetical protein
MPPRSQPSEEPFIGEPVSSHSQGLLNALRTAKGMVRIGITIVSDDLFDCIPCLPTLGHSLAKIVANGETYRIHIARFQFPTQPDIISGQCEYDKYLQDGNKEHLGEIDCTPSQGVNTNRLVNKLQEYINGRRFAFLGPFHNCYSFAAGLGKAAGAKDLMPPYFVPRVPVIALKRHGPDSVD